MGQWQHRKVTVTGDSDLGKRGDDRPGLCTCDGSGQVSLGGVDAARWQDKEGGTEWAIWAVLRGVGRGERAGTFRGWVGVLKAHPFYSMERGEAAKCCLFGQRRAASKNVPKEK